MFDAIATRYDLLNHVLSMWQDRRWRRKAVRALKLTGTETLVDLCTGTGDLVFEACRNATPPARVAGVDIASGMLDLARRKRATSSCSGKRPPAWFVRGDASRLPIRDASADAVTIAFGIRNVPRPQVVLDEIARVLRPGGRLAILEFGMPRTPCLGRFYSWYFRRVLPVIGGAVSGRPDAYRYLPASVGAFPSGAEFTALLPSSTFSDVRFVRLTFGIVYLYSARRR